MSLRDEPSPTATDTTNVTPPASAVRRWSLLRIGSAVSLVLAVLAFPALGVHQVRPTLVMSDVPVNDALDDLLAEVVTPDGVDYLALIGRSADLERIVAAFAETGPRSTPERYSTVDEELAYYINAYNALTLFGVASHWPIETVHDVHGWFRIKEGFGFFWATRFRLDGRSVNLYDLENDTIRADFGDARIHAAINCASESCPALSARSYRAETLDEQLDAATISFASDAPHVVIDDDSKQIQLTPIYQWFAEDFVADAVEAGVGDSALDWILMFARADVADQLGRARDAGYEVVYVDYDWSLNSAGN
jgi:hypothetical protein